MSAKDEILALNQDISAIDKKIFEVKIKQGQLAKELKKAENDLELASLALIECIELFNDTKNKDTVDIIDFKNAKLVLENQTEVQKEALSNTKILKKTLADGEALLIHLENYKQLKKQELNNNYGQIKEFKPNSNNSSST